MEHLILNGISKERVYICYNMVMRSNCGDSHIVGICEIVSESEKKHTSISRNKG